MNTQEKAGLALMALILALAVLGLAIVTRPAQNNMASVEPTAACFESWDNCHRTACPAGWVPAEGECGPGFVCCTLITPTPSTTPTWLPTWTTPPDPGAHTPTATPTATVVEKPTETPVPHATATSAYDERIKALEYTRDRLMEGIATMEVAARHILATKTAAVAAQTVTASPVTYQGSTGTGSAFADQFALSSEPCPEYLTRPDRCVNVASACPTGTGDAPQYQCGAGFRCCLPPGYVAPTATRYTLPTPGGPVPPTATPIPSGDLAQRVSALETRVTRLENGANIQPPATSTPVKATNTPVKATATPVPGGAHTSPKKGTAGEGTAAQMQALGASWGYTWGENSEAWDGVFEHVPMIWGASYDAATVTSIARAHPGSYWLIWNEPDWPGQADFPATQGAQIYHELRPLLKGADPQARLIVGNVAQFGSGWLGTFRSEYQRLYGEWPVVEGWGVHQYTTRAYDAAAWRASLLAVRDWMMANGGYVEVFLSEFGCLEDAGVAETVMWDQVWWLESQDWITRYAWFGTASRVPTCWSCTGALLNDDGSLSALGQRYRSLP